MDPLRQLFQRRKALADAAVSREKTERLSRVRKFLIEKSRTGRWKDGLSVLSRAVSAGIPVDSNMLAVAINSAGQAKHFGAAKHIFQQHETLKVQPERAAQHAILNAAASCGRWQFAVAHLVHIARGQQRQLPALPEPADAAVLSRQRKDNASDTAVEPETAHETNNKNFVDTKMLAYSLRACVNQWKVAATLFNIMRKPGVPVRHPHHQNGDVEVGNSSSVEMTAPLSTPPVSLRQKCEDTRDVISSLTASFARARQWHKCLSLLNAAERQRLPLDSRVYNYTLRSCFEADRYGVVASLMGKMITRGIPPQEDSCRVVLTAVEEECARMAEDTPASTWVLACVVFNALASQGLRLNRSTYEAPMRACCAAGRWEQAALFLREMRHDGLDIGGHNFESVVCARIRSAANMHTAARMLRIGALSSLSLAPDEGQARCLEGVEHPLVVAQRGGGGGGGSSHLVQAAFAAGPGERLMNAYLSTALRLGDLPAARECARRMRQRSLPISLETLANRLRMAEASGRPLSVLRHYLVYQAVIDSQRQEVLSSCQPQQQQHTQMPIASSSSPASRANNATAPPPSTYEEKSTSGGSNSTTSTLALPPALVPPSSSVSRDAAATSAAVISSNGLGSVSSLTHADYRLGDGVAEAVERACLLLGNKEPLVAMCFPRLKRELHEQRQKHTYVAKGVNETVPRTGTTQRKKREAALRTEEKTKHAAKLPSDDEILAKSIRRRGGGLY